MIKKILLICVLGLTACTDPKNAQRILEDNGYTDVRLTGYSWFSCGQGDTYRDGFIAKSPVGRDVEGTVCSGWLFKNSTIRFE